jgi:hypothetical protein
MIFFLTGFFWIFFGYGVVFSGGLKKNFATRYYLGRQCDADDAQDVRGPLCLFHQGSENILTRCEKFFFFKDIMGF